jgi:Fe-S-cluster containining protein
LGICPGQSWCHSGLRQRFGRAAPAWAASGRIFSVVVFIGILFWYAILVMVSHQETGGEAPMKAKILCTIYDIFNQWNHGLATVCRRGCSGCCTQNVTITAVEGTVILRYILQQDMSLWLAEKLASPPVHLPPKMTTNDFAAACIEGREVDSGEQYNLSICPFLEKNLCHIYPVRPFGCRLFVSTRTCSAMHPAQVSDAYFEAATAVTQLIEHLGQKEYWGNMLDVLPALLDIGEFRPIADHVDSTRIIQARLRTLTAKPLPGFLFGREHEQEVSSLLHNIFTAEVGGKTVEDILNGK